MSGTLSIGDKTVVSHSDITDKTTLTADEANVGSNALVVNSSGNVGIGTSSINSKLTTQTASTNTSTFDFGLQINNSYSSNDSIASLGFHNRADVNSTGVGAAIAFVGGGTAAGSGNLVFAIKDTSNISNTVDAADEKMRIDSSGMVSVGSYSIGYTTVGVRLKPTGASHFAHNSAGSTNMLVSAPVNEAQISFYRQDTGAGMGSITNGSSNTVSYNTSSDYRLKENINGITDGITRVKQLNPSRFNFIADPDNTIDGFIAHEVQPIVPEAIHGEKDAVDDDGNPEYQGIDQSKLVPLLTAALQESIALIESQQSQIDALTAKTQEQDLTIASLISRIEALETA